MKNKGFSFVELLVAIVILGIISLPIASSFALSAKIDAKARETYSASNAAEEILLIVTEIDFMPAVDSNETIGVMTDETLKNLDDKIEYYIQKWITTSSPEARQSNAVAVDDVYDIFTYSFEYRGYDVELVLTNHSSFYRVDITLTYSVAGDTMQITRKGVLPIA